MTLVGMFSKDTVTRWRPTYSTDRHNNRVRSGWDHSVTYPASVVPVGGREDVTEREYVEQNYVAYLPVNADITATDQLEWNGTRYEVDGSPNRYQNRLRILDALEVKLQQRSG